MRQTESATVPNDFLYHYSSTQTAFAILQSRSFRLSALSGANDSLEGRYLGKVFSTLLKDAQIERGVIEVASVIVEGYPDATEGFALCLSENSDLLSQWRAYAQDGTGMAIGVDPAVFAKDFGQEPFGSNFFDLIKVEYGDKLLIEYLQPFVEQMRRELSEYGEFIKLRGDLTREEVSRAMADRATNVQGQFVGQRTDAPALLDKLINILSPMHFHIYGTKPNSFHEEKEWRVIRFRHRTAVGDIQYFADQTSVRPFIPSRMSNAASMAVREVVLGPKHRSDINWMRSFLASVGLPHVKVRLSAITSYR
jgi:hypothetical protein